MKRLFVSTVLVGALLAPAITASASTTSTGSAKLQWTTSPTATMAIATQYNGAFAQGLAAPQLLSSVAGVCGAPASETAFTLSFGSLTPKAGVSSACLYKNALAVSIATNDGQGYAINQYLDSAPAAGVGLCAFPNGGASFPLAPAVAPVAVTVRNGNPAAGTFTGANLTSCAAGGSIVPAGAGGISSGGANPGNPGTAGLEFYSPSSAQLGMMTSAVSTSNGAVIQTLYGAEDLQLNLGPGVVSTAGAASIYLTIQLILN